MINFALIGCGFISRMHAEAIEKIPDARLYAVCDKIHDNMLPYAQLGAKTFTDVESLLEDPDVHVVNICVPSGLHAALAIQAAKAGKHIVLEKPMALTAEDAVEIIKVCEQQQVKLAVVHPNRFRPALVELKKLLDAGWFGKISHINATVRWNRNNEYYRQAAWRGTKAMDGGVLMNQAIHNLDLMLWLMGPVREVQAYAATRLRDIECEDVAVAVAEFESGALGVIEAATTIYPRNLEESISIFGEKGTAVIRGPRADRFEHLTVEGLSEAETKAIMEKGSAPLSKTGHQWIIEDMIASIKTNKEPAINGKSGYDAVKLVQSIVEAAEQRRPISLNTNER